MNAAATQHRTAGARQFFTATPQIPSQSARALYAFPLCCRTRVDAVNTFRVSAGRFASFRVVKSSISAVHAVLCAWFDSRQLHKEHAGQGRKLWPVFFFSSTPHQTMTTQRRGYSKTL
ncbi:MAG: hypothetical protein WAL41_29625, partial [Mycobacterium sp.]